MNTLHSSLHPADSPLVTIADGRLSGVWRGSSAAFLGIPFATAPVGEHRFLAPAPVQPWHGTRNASAFGATPQRRPFGELTTIPEPSFPGDATLNVNVFTPAPGQHDAQLPVFVWFHGGGYFAGSPSSPWYDGASFNRDGIVTVSVSYRLGFDGFGWIEGAPMNRGLLDQIAALEWVRSNIRAFGGDPDKVTIGGQSAGGGSVMALLATPRTDGLFRSAIAQSGSVGRITMANAERAGRQLASIVGVAPTLAGWQSVSEATVLDHEREINNVSSSLRYAVDLNEIIADVTARKPEGLQLAFSPVIDGDVLPIDVESAFSSGAGSQVSLMMGATRNEVGFPSTELVDDIADALRGQGISEEAIRGYRSGVVSLGEEYARSQLVTSGLFRRIVIALGTARVATGLGERTWLYDFSFRAPRNDRASHCFDLPFSWDLLSTEGVLESLGSPLPQQLADSMHGAWVQFIRDGFAPWPSMTQHATGAMRFDVTSGFDEAAFAFETALLGALSHR